MGKYTSVTEFFSLPVPDGWISQELVPGGAFVMANSQSALDRYRGGEAVEAGDWVINVGFLPYRLLETNELRALNFQLGASPEIFLQSLMPMFQVEGDLVIGEAELVSLNDEREAGSMTISGQGREGTVLMFSAGERVIGLVSTVALPGEAISLQGIAYSVASEATFGGSQDALYGALLGG